ncbi:MAG: helix-turn-helix domain-containing protein, partial [Phycisphaerae bacterium]
MAKIQSATAETIRSLRSSRGWTQHQLAERLRVSAVTVARWETGQRRCAGANAQLVRALIADFDDHLRARASAITTLKHENLQRLDAVSAVDTFRELLFCQARWRQVPITNIHITSAIKKDGGIDASIDAGAMVSADELLIAGGTYFQIKTGETTKPWNRAWVQRELFGDAKT